jgi:hypothetical protein
MGLDIWHLIPTKYGPDTNPLDFFLVNELEAPADFTQAHLDKIVTINSDEVPSSRLYYLEKGYQRKGMDKQFYKDFINDKIYYDLDSVLKAYHYLTKDHMDSLQNRQNNFKENFIDNFMVGQSMFFVSW